MEVPDNNHSSQEWNKIANNVILVTVSAKVRPPTATIANGEPADGDQSTQTAYI